MPLQLIALGFIAILALRRLLHSLSDRLTVHNDLKRVHSPIDSQRDGTAVVIGGSVAGLLHAAILKTHFARVIIIEAESVTTDPSTPRYRLPQWNQLHVFLPIVPAILSALCPGLIDRLVQHYGAICHPVRGRSTLRRHGGQTLHSSNESAPWLQVSREVFEAELRREVNVETITGLATGFKYDDQAVSSVSVRRPDGTTCAIDAAFVVDASGPACVSSRFLVKAGFATPDRHSYDPRVRYSCFDVVLSDAMVSRIDQEAGYDDPVDQLLIPGGTFFDDGRLVACTSIGQRTWRYLVATTGDDPRDPKTWGDFVQQFAADRHDFPTAFNIATSIIISELDHWPVRNAAKDLPCHFVKHTPKTLPSNLVVVGDAAIKLNPKGSQGVAKAAIEAVTLDRVLRSGADIVPAFLKLQHSRVGNLYRSARAVDYALSDTIIADGDTRHIGQCKHRFAVWYTRAGQKDATIGSAVSAVGAMMASPLTLLSPVLLIRALYVHLVR